MTRAPFRHDIVGSFLRPEVLKVARENFEEGRITRTELTKTENEEIIKLIEKQKENGLLAVTDGEFRRRWWHLDFILGLNGTEKISYGAGEIFNVHANKIEAFVFTDKISFPKDHPFIEHFKFVKEHAGDAVAKQTIPGPNMILSPYVGGKAVRDIDPYDGDIDALIDNLVETYRDIISAFYDAGCRYLQLDDTAWGALLDAKYQKGFEDLGYDYRDLVQKFGYVTERALANKPKDMVITTHFCRGNFQSSWLYEGDYDVIAQRLFAIDEFDGFFMEYDTERAGDFDALKYLKNQKIVLGLITSKSAELEDIEEVKARIKEATKYVPLEQICISPQCGFASTVEGNKLTEEGQWRKIRFLKEIADEVF